MRFSQYFVPQVLCHLIKHLLDIDIILGAGLVKHSIDFIGQHLSFLL